MDVKRELDDFESEAEVQQWFDVPIIHPNNPVTNICIKQENAFDANSTIEVRFSKLINHCKIVFILR
jgi:hypothetical protein